jgi:hypothetical protein
LRRRGPVPLLKSIQAVPLSPREQQQGSVTLANEIACAHDLAIHRSTELRKLFQTRSVRSE